MGVIRKLHHDWTRPANNDYVDLGERVGTSPGDLLPSDGAGMTVHIAEIAEQGDVAPIMDAVYDGDMVIADITRLRINDPTAEHIASQLRQTAAEIDGDIVQRGDDQYIITPSRATISREKL